VSSWFESRSRHGGVDKIPLPGDVGGLWLCGKHFIAPDAERAMQHVHATVVVCLTQRAELAHRYPQYVEWLQTQPSDRIVWFPIPDLGAPRLEQLVPLLEDLRERVQGGETLLMHCGAGVGRAGTLAAGLLMTLGLGEQEALDVVAKHRPMGGPEAGAQREVLRALGEV
jgi:protein-tyrosine phosphatase